MYSFITNLLPHYHPVHGLTFSSLKQPHSIVLQNCGMIIIVVHIIAVKLIV